MSAEREPFSFSADWEAMWRHALDDEQAEHPEMAPEEVELLLEEKFRAAKAEMKAEEQMHETAYALLEQVWPEDDAPGLVAQ